MLSQSTEEKSSKDNSNLQSCDFSSNVQKWTSVLKGIVKAYTKENTILTGSNNPFFTEQQKIYEKLSFKKFEDIRKLTRQSRVVLAKIEVPLSHLVKSANIRFF